MPPAWWVEPLVWLCGTGVAVALLILFMSQSEPSEEDHAKDRTP